MRVKVIAKTFINESNLSLPSKNYFLTAKCYPDSESQQDRYRFDEINYKFDSPTNMIKFIKSLWKN